MPCSTNLLLKITIFLVCLLLMLPSTNAILFKKRVKLTKKNNYVYLTKFAIGEGGYGKFKARVKFISPYQGPTDQYTVRVSYYDYQKWQIALGYEV